MKAYRVEVGMVFDVEAETEHDAERKLLEGFRNGQFAPSADEIAVIGKYATEHGVQLAVEDVTEKVWGKYPECKGE